MNTKKILSLIVALAMIVTVVSVFTLTANAATYEKGDKFTYNGITYETLSDNLVYNGDLSETTSANNYTYVTGWKGGYVNGTHEDLSNEPYLLEGSAYASTESAVFNYTAATDSEPAYVTIPDTSVMSDTTASYPWKSDASEGYMGLVLTNWMRDSREDASTYLKAESGKTYYMSFEMKATSINSSSWVNNVVGFSAVTEDGDTYESSIPGTNGDITTLTHVLDNSIGRARYLTTADTWTKIDTVATANADGYFMFQLGWSHEWGVVSVRNFEIYEIDLPETSKDITATYTVGGDPVKTVTKTIDTATATEASFDEVYYSADGSNTLYYAKATTLSESQTIKMDALDNPGLALGSYVVSGSQTYKTVSANLIPNGDFSYGLNGWYGADDNPASSDNITLSDGKITLGNTGSKGEKSLYRSWAIESDKTYLFTYNTSAANGWQITSLVSEKYVDENDTDATVLVGTTDKSTKVGSLAASDAAGTNNFVFTNDTPYPYLQVRFRWSTSTLDDFGIYELEEVGEYPVSVTAPPAVTVISGNAPVLPKTVSAKGNLGNDINPTVTWDDASDLQVGENTVHGTIEGYEAGVDASVTVLPVLFTMSDIDAYAGQSASAVHYFPNSLSGSMSVEFDVVFKQLVNGTITIGDAASNAAAGGKNPVFGGIGDAISIQTNTSGINVRSWGENGGGSVSANETYSVTTGETYRIFITTDTDTNKWTAVMTDKDGKRTTIAEDYTYRKVVDKLDSITSLDNNSNSDTITLSNIKVSIPVPTLTPALGWNADTAEFTVDFLFNAPSTVKWDVTVITSPTDEGTPATVEAGQEGFSVSVNSNVPVAAYIDNRDSATPVTSVYALVAAALADENSGFGTKYAVAADQIEVVNEIINDGGVYIYENGNLNEDAAKIMSYDSETKTATLNKTVVAAGVTFAGGETSVIVDDDSFTATDVEGVMLLEVELVYEPVSENAAADADVEAAFDFDDIL